MNTSETPPVITVCPHCKNSFTYGKTRGRNPIYCSDNCRKYAAAHRKYAKVTETPIRVLKDKPHLEPRPAPKTITVYQRPRKADLRAFMRENPTEIIPAMVQELGYCLTSRSIPKTERQHLAQVFGNALSRLHAAEYKLPTNEPREPSIVSGLTDEQYGTLAHHLGVFEEFMTQVRKDYENIRYRKTYLEALARRRAEKRAEEIAHKKVRELEKRNAQLERAQYERPSFSQMKTQEQINRLESLNRDYDRENRLLYLDAFERREEVERLTAHVEELEKQNRNLTDKLRRAKRRR